MANHRADDTATSPSSPTEPLPRPAPADSSASAPAEHVDPIDAALPSFARETPRETLLGGPDSDERAEASLDDVLPNFDPGTPNPRDEAPGVRATEGTDPLTQPEAESFLALSEQEHRTNLVAFLLVLLAPAALFFTLAFPRSGTSFGEQNPAMATATGLGLALVLIVAGLAVHFAPRSRPTVLTTVESGELTASEESHEVAQGARRRTRTRRRALNIAGGLCGVLALALAALALGSLGDPGRVFLFLGLTFVSVAASFAFVYRPFATKRTVKHLSL